MYLHRADDMRAIGAVRRPRSKSESQSSAKNVMTMSLCPSARDCVTPTGAHPNNAIARDRSKVDLCSMMCLTSASDPIHAAASRLLDTIAVVSTLSPAVAMAAPENRPHNGPYDMTI